MNFPKIPNTELYLAGGCVRDLLLGKQPKDRDFVVITTMSFKELVSTIEKIPSAKIFLAKPEFMTIRCLIDGEAIDLVYPRKEGGYEDFRHPTSVVKADSLREDALRRDFTINAMYMTDGGNVIDFYNGLEHLEYKAICCVGNAEERFREDALRILRAVRFEAQLGFIIAPETEKAMRMSAKNLEHISSDRIREELNKALKMNAPNTLEWVKQLKLYSLLEDKGLHFELTSKQ